MDSTEGVLPVETWRELDFRSLAALLGRDIPGKLLPPLVSNLAVGVAAESTETTDLIGKTRSVAEGLNGPYEESTESEVSELVSCMLGKHSVEGCSLAPRNARSLDFDSEFECCRVGEAEAEGPSVVGEPVPGGCLEESERAVDIFGAEVRLSGRLD